jgi:hypothetical protein
MLFAVTIAASSADSDTSQPISSEVGMIQLALITPRGVDYIDVSAYRGKDTSGELVERVTLASGVYSVLFPKLSQATYFITAKAFDENGTLMYQGSGSAAVVSEVTNILTILLNQKIVENTSNRAPRIDSFKAFGRTTEGNGELYVLAPKKNEPVQFTVAVSDDNGDKTSIRWTVTDSPSPGGVDAGTILSDREGSSIIWKHDQEGTYWVNIFANDGKGGAAAFTFSVTVLTNESDLDVRFFFNSFPTVVTSTKNEKAEAKNKKNTRKTITLDASGSADPDGDPLDYLWTTDCAFAKMTGTAAAEKVALVATKEETCTATVHVFDTLGYNTAKVALDICCQEGNQHCGICSPMPPRTITEQSDFQLSASSAIQSKRIMSGCTEEPSGKISHGAPAAKKSQTNAGGMCKI